MSPAGPAPAPRFLTAADRNRLIEEILAYVRSVVDSSDSAVPMARAAQMVISRFGDQVLATRWAGAGTFRDLLEGRENPGFAISALKPGYIYDPARHQLPIDGRPEELVGDPQLNALAYRVHQLTDTPYLTRGDYARVFRLTAEEVNDHGYFLTRTSKSVRDRCIEEGSPIARASVNFILRGITFGGHRFGQNGSEEPLDLGACFFRNVVSLCDTAGIALDDQERETLVRLDPRRAAGRGGDRPAGRPRGRRADEEPVAVGVAGGSSEDSGGLMGDPAMTWELTEDEAGSSSRSPPRTAPSSSSSSSPTGRRPGACWTPRAGWSPSETDALPLWPHATLAAACAVGPWEGRAPGAGHRSTSCSTDLLPLLAEDGLRVAVFPSPRDPGLLLAPAEVRERLEREMEIGR